MLWVNICILIGTVIFMEGVAWFTHKYVMHGFLWVLHRDHHDKTSKGFLEDNDAFFLIFAIPSIILIFLGRNEPMTDYRLWIGAGIALYGTLYFLVHDIFIHQRFKIFRKTNIPYFKAIRRAHKVHHKHIQKEDGECFGMLYVPKKYHKVYQDKL